MTSCALRGQEGHGSRYIDRSNILFIVIADSTTGYSVNSTVAIELQYLVSDGVQETEVQTRLPSGKTSTSFVLSHNDRRASQFTSRTLVVVADVSQKVLDCKKGPADVHSITLIPVVERQVPNGSLASSIRLCRVNDKDISGSKAFLGFGKSRLDRSFICDIAVDYIQSREPLSVDSGELKRYVIEGCDAASVI